MSPWSKTSYAFGKIKDMSSESVDQHLVKIIRSILKWTSVTGKSIGNTSTNQSLEFCETVAYIH